MSLGYNSQKPIRTTNMPGAIGNMVVRSSARRSPPSRVTASIVRAALSSSSAEKPVVLEPPKRQTTVTPSPPPSEVPTADDNWVFATASEDIHDEENQCIASKGERMLLVYPQVYDKETGKVRMKAKVAHKETGQLRHVWIDVYSGPDEDVRHVHSFSLVP